MERNDKGRLRIGAVNVGIQIESPAEMLVHLDRVLAQFEDFCIVTQSVRSGFPVEITVRDSAGTILKWGFSGRVSANIPANHSA